MTDVTSGHDRIEKPVMHTACMHDISQLLRFTRPSRLRTRPRRRHVRDIGNFNRVEALLIVRLRKQQRKMSLGNLKHQQQCPSIDRNRVEVFSWQRQWDEHSKGKKTLWDDPRSRHKNCVAYKTKDIAIFYCRILLNDTWCLQDWNVIFRVQTSACEYGFTRTVKLLNISSYIRTLS